MFFEKLPDFGVTYEVSKMRQLVEILQRKFMREVVYRPVVATGIFSMPKDADFVLADTSSAAVDISLPLAKDRPNQTIVIKDIAANASANNITLIGDADNEVEGSTSLVLGNDAEAARLRSDGASWWRI